jgi:hypothetical protein
VRHLARLPVWGILLVALAACSNGEVVRTGHAPQPAPSTTGPVHASPALPDRIAYTVLDLEDLDFEPFLSPTRNIGCVLGPTGGSCDLIKATWTAPPSSADCEGDFKGRYGACRFLLDRYSFRCTGPGS